MQVYRLAISAFVATSMEVLESYQVPSVTEGVLLLGQTCVGVAGPTAFMNLFQVVSYFV